MKRTVLITRPEEDALPLAETLRARDLRVLIEPMLRIKPTREVKIDLEGVQALLFSSSNGVRAFAAMVKNRDLPVYTTGEASARVARNLGFKSVEGADGDVSGLVRLVRQRLKPEDGALFHGAGSVVAGDLATQLASLGYNLRREVVYEAVQADALSPQLLQRFEAGEIDMVLLFSPRTAETFLSLMDTAGDKQPALRDALRNVTALCMSRAVADTAQRATWRGIDVAERPELNAMLGLIERTVAALDSGAEEIEMPSEASASSPPAGSPGPKPRPTIDMEPSGTPRRRGRWVWISAAAVTLFVVLAGLATMPAWRSLFGDLSGPGEIVSTPATTAEPASEPAAAPESAAEEAAPEEPTVTAEAEATHEPLAEPVPEATDADGATGATATEEPTPEATEAEATDAEAAAAGETATEQVSADQTSDDAGTGETATTTTATDTTGNTEPETEPAADLSGQETAATDEAMAGAGSGAADPRVDELMARLTAIEQAVASGGDSNGASADTLAAIENRLAALEESGGGQAAANDEIAVLSERVTAIEQLLIDFMTEVPAQSLADVKTEVQRLIDENAGLRDQLATLTERFEQADSTAFMLAVGRLGAALNEGRPFEAELETLRKLAAADPALGRALPALETLSPLAAAGAPSVISLTARFPETARAIVQAAQQEGVGANTESAGWFDRLLGRISELVTVRPVGEDVEGDGPAARVARAEARLAVGDLAGAVAELDGLTGAPAEAAAAWLATAKARLAVVPAFEALDALALERLGTGAGGSAATGG